MELICKYCKNINKEYNTVSEQYGYYADKFEGFDVNKKIVLCNKCRLNGGIKKQNSYYLVKVNTKEIK